MKARLLVVDDEPSILFALSDYLGTLDYTVDCASDLTTAQTLLREETYSLIIADLRLGGIESEEGLVIVTCVKQHCPGTRIVLITAYGSPGLEVEALKRGADMVLNKPIALAKLAQIVSTLIEGKP